MSFVINSSHHSSGQSSCEECIYGYPRKCRCGGFVHAEHVASDVSRGGSGFKYVCDKCGDRFLKQQTQVDNRKRYKKKAERHKK